MDSLLIVVGALALLTVAVRGNVLQTLWLCLSLLDTFRALKTVRQNGRRVGVTTRRRLMRQCLTSWIVFVAAEPVTIICDALLYWFPFYASLKQLALLVSAVWRVETSGWLFEQLLVPAIRRYEKHIDLTFLLVHSLYSVIFHFLLDLPLQFLRRRAQEFGLWPSGLQPEAQDAEPPKVDDSDKPAEDAAAAPDVSNGSGTIVEPPTVAPPVEHQQPKPVASAPRQPLGRPRLPSAASSHARARIPSDTTPGGAKQTPDRCLV
ncbi:uncharacterized protein LOC62_04G006313 [Vanrija pseudolonga]|uniref:Uncharacterized protein n=1 Tax=Vanrija pseudolonga TaxID=143232 RepID=A0AAF1BS02_9TREE|nr:hypothetical protein LOC62_04G006313 [Vanrija pseudolonga]